MEMTTTVPDLLGDEYMNKQEKWVITAYADK